MGNALYWAIFSSSSTSLLSLLVLHKAAAHFAAQLTVSANETLLALHNVLLLVGELELEFHAQKVLQFQ